MAKVKVAINGFGRIGRLVLRAGVEDGNIDFVAINDLTDAKTLAHLLKYDSVHRQFKGKVKAKEGAIVVNGKEIKIISERDPAKLPWKELEVDIVVESTGLFRTAETAGKHLTAGAKKVILSAPGKGDIKTVVVGVNDKNYDPAKDHLVSNASCTTNCLAPFAKIIHEKFGIVGGLMTTIHAYTNDQKILDLPHSDLRRARAAAMSMIPTTTGAAKAVGLVIPELKGKLNGMAIRVPTSDVSVVDLTVDLAQDTTVAEVNKVLKEAANSSLKGIMDFSEEPLVSIDYTGNSHSSIIDGLSTMMMGSRQLKVLSWYDNEWGFSSRMVDLINIMAKSL